LVWSLFNIKKTHSEFIDKVHKKVASWLARTFDVIILPTFNVHRCHVADGEEDLTIK